MNVNEVIANVALELLEHQKGEYDYVHPNNHVSFSQSTNDTYLTAFRLALYRRIEGYIKSLKALEQAFARKGKEFVNVLKMGRTQLQDAVSMTLGAEFHGFSTTIKEDMQRLKEAKTLICEINMSATAIGMPTNVSEGYPQLAPRDTTGIPVVPAEDLIQAASGTGAYVQVSGILKRTAGDI